MGFTMWFRGLFRSKVEEPKVETRPASPVRQYTIKSITEFIIEVSAPGEFITPAGVEMMLFSGISCKPDDDCNGSIRLNVRKQSIQFEAPALVLMDATLNVSEGRKEKCRQTLNDVLEIIREQNGGDPKIITHVANMAEAMSQLMEPMISIDSAPFALRELELLSIERVDDKGHKIDRPLTVYLRGLKVVAIQ